MEIKFTVTIYHFENDRQIAEFRELIQERILEEVELRGQWMGPVVAEVVDGEEIVA